MTPLLRRVEDYAAKGRARFHMPGHKGVLSYFGGVARYDVSEVEGCGSLYESGTVIEETESAYSSLYGSAASLLSAGGSTLCIQTMLALAARPGGRVLCGRGCHTAAINAMALLDLEPEWIYPETDPSTGLAKAITPQLVRRAADENPSAGAVCVTSPDYYGVICDVEAIGAVCRELSLPLLVDNAHGAHLRFLDPSIHPINLGADMCCDSLHKTLPVLTGGAMLHIGNRRYISGAKRYMSMFGSASPSYLVMLSADRALIELCGDFPKEVAETSARVKELEIRARRRGFVVPGESRDPLRLVLGFKGMGYEEDEFSQLIRAGGIEPELVGGGFCVLMASPRNSPQDFERLGDFIENLPAKPAVEPNIPIGARPRKAVSLREAAFASTEEVRLPQAVGRVAGTTVCPCPPGIPLVVPGELICENLACLLKSYGILRLNVLKS